MTVPNTLQMFCSLKFSLMVHFCLSSNTTQAEQNTLLLRSVLSTVRNDVGSLRHRMVASFQSLLFFMLRIE